MKQALEALEEAHPKPYNESVISHVEAITALRTAIAEAEKQEPVACRTLCELCVKRGYDFCANAAKTTPIITTPPAAQRQPLTDEEIEAVWKVAMFEDNGRHALLDNQPFVHFARAIEAKLKEKNT